LKWITAENRLKNYSGGNPEYALRQTRIPDFADELARSTVMQGVDPNLNGCYEGQVALADGSNRIWQARMDVAFQAGDGAPSGHSLIELSENGKVFSRSDNTGNQQNFRRFADNSSALLVVASDSLYFQLYYLASADQYVGNLYRKDGVVKYSFAGTTTLFRRASCP
jgi:hypothetical protein